MVVQLSPAEGPRSDQGRRAPACDFAGIDPGGFLETPTVVEHLEMKGVPGGGISDSGNRVVLAAAAKQCRESGLPLALDEVIAHALRSERMEADGRCVGADDVVPITVGGAVEVFTYATGVVAYEPIGLDRAWIEGRMLFAFRPGGKRHRVPDQLGNLFRHARARGFVEEISRHARAAADALRRRDIEALAAAVRLYVAAKSDWSGGRYVDPAAAEVASRLAEALGPDLLATKPPGAGGAMSLFALVRDPSALAAAIARFRAEGWDAAPVSVSRGLRAEVINDYMVRLHAPHRADLIGAADVGMDPAIGLDGVCCSMAIEPISTLMLTFPRPIRRRDVDA